MTHFPWDLVVLAMLVIIVGVILFVVLGRRIGAQNVRQIPSGSEARTGLKKDNPFAPPPPSPPSGNPEQDAAASESGEVRQPPPLPSASEAGRKAALSSAFMSVISRDDASKVGNSVEAYQSGPAVYAVPEQDTEQAQRLLEVKRILPSFQAEGFLREADRAFRSVVSGYAAGDRTALEPFVTSALLESLVHEAEKRKETGHIKHFILRHLERLQIRDVVIEDTQIRVNVAITSWQVNYQTNKDGVVTEGVESLTEFRDLWCFVHERSDLAVSAGDSVKTPEGKRGWVLVESSVF